MSWINISADFDKATNSFSSSNSLLAQVAFVTSNICVVSKEKESIISKFGTQQEPERHKMKEVSAVPQTTSAVKSCNRKQFQLLYVCRKPITLVIIEPLYDKTNKVACAPSEISNQRGYQASLIRVLNVRLKGS